MVPLVRGLPTKPVDQASRSSRVPRSDPAWARAPGSRRALQTDAATVMTSTTAMTSSEVVVSI
jgi:hypothetical protein